MKKVPKSDTSFSGPQYKIVSYALGTILRERAAILPEVKHLADKVFGVAEIRDLERALLARLPMKVNEGTVRESIRLLAGTRVTFQELDETCWRILGNVPRMTAGTIVRPWTRQTHGEWVPAQITRVRLARGGKKGHELGYEMYFRVLGGTSCPALIEQWWSRKKCAYFATRHNEDMTPNGWGFSRRSRSRRDGAAVPKFPYLDARQFVNMRCYVFIEPELSAGAPQFRRIMFTPSVSEWNREQQRYRARWETQYACVFKFPRSLPCHQCPIGLDQCRAAVHRKTYVIKQCNQCGLEDQPHDPVDLYHTCCVECVEKAILNGE